MQNISTGTSKQVNVVHIRVFRRFPIYTASEL